MSHFVSVCASACMPVGSCFHSEHLRAWGSELCNFMHWHMINPCEFSPFLSLLCLMQSIYCSHVVWNDFYVTTKWVFFSLLSLFSKNWRRLMRSLRYLSVCASFCVCRSLCVYPPKFLLGGLWDHLTVCMSPPLLLENRPLLFNVI
jgi:hypothetical protein